MVRISNDYLDVVISKHGAELKSIKDKAGTEYLWIGDPNVWAGQAPIMFPICGGLKDDKYIWQGREYSINKHGYAKLSDFEVIRSETDYAAFLLRSNEETKKIYPFDYEFTVSFRLVEKSIQITYAVKNLTSGEMYCSFGAHEAYYCPEAKGIEDYKVIFDAPQTLKSWQLAGNLVKNEAVTVLENGTELELDYNYFAIDALVFRDIPFSAVTLAHKSGEKKLRVDFGGFPYFMMWTKPGAHYICLEPWCGTPDPVSSDYVIEHKPGINRIDAGATFERVHTITIF